MNGKNVAVLISCMIIIGIVSVGFTINMTNGTITSGLFAKASAQQQSSNYTLSTNSIPNWFRNATKWWSEGQTSDSDFLNAMKYLIDNGIIRISQTYSLPLIASQNSTMVQKIDDLQTRYDALQMKYNELLTQTQNVPGNQISNSNNYAESISAVSCISYSAKRWFLSDYCLQRDHLEDNSQY